MNVCVGGMRHGKFGGEQRVLHLVACLSCAFSLGSVGVALDWRAQDQ